MLFKNLVLLNGVLALAILAQQVSAQQSVTQPQSSPYRVVLAVSSNSAEHKIAEAAADGYRVLSVVPTNSLNSAPVISGETEDKGGSGITIILKRTSQAFEYRFIAVGDAKEFEKSLNRFGAQGFRLIPSTLHLGWAEQRRMELILDPDAYSRHQKHRVDVPVALMEKGPGGSARYSYQQVSKVSDIEKLAARGYVPVAGNALWNFLVLESASTSAAPQTKVKHARLAKFSTGSTTHSDITRDIATNVPERKDLSENTADPLPEPDVKFEDAALAGKQLLLLEDGLAGFNLAPVLNVLTTSGTPDTPPSYRLLLRNDLGALEKAVNESAVEGYRLFPKVATAFRTKTRLHGSRALGFIPTLDATTTLELHRVIAVMYPPAPRTTTYEYRIVSPSSPVDLLKVLNGAEADGFQFVSFGRGILALERVRSGGGLQ